jgi:hypothetical protein
MNHLLIIAGQNREIHTMDRWVALVEDREFGYGPGITEIGRAPT